MSQNDITLKAATIAAFILCDPVGTRTLDPLIKSQLLYQLSYRVFINKMILFSITFVTRPGFEPRQTESESVVLPLYYRAVKNANVRFNEIIF